MSTVNLSDCFDHIYCLNLDKRPDRWRKVKQAFKELNITVERIAALDGNKLSEGKIKKYPSLNKCAIGCMLSHYKIIEDAKKHKYKNILIFEDDVIFHKNFIEEFSKQIKKIKNWKLLHLGATQTHWENIEIKDGFYYSLTSLGTFAIGINESIYEEVVALTDINAAIDTKYVNIQHKHYKECYTFYPNLVIADVSNSDIRGQRDEGAFRKMVKWDKSLYEVKEYETNQNKKESGRISEMFNDKIKVLLLPDTQGWAFDNIASAIIKYNPYPDKIVYNKLFIRDLKLKKQNIDISVWDYIYVMFEGDIYIPFSKNKIIRGCYSARWLENKYCTIENIAAVFNQNKAAIFVNDFLKDSISPLLKSDIQVETMCESSDENLFYPINNKKSNKFTAIFVGNVDRKLKNFDKIEEICKKADINLIVCKDTPYTELVHEYNKADICINFSTMEGGPQTFIESALCGIPMLIRSNIPLSKKIPCFTGNSEEDFIQTILWLKQDRNRCIKMGERARQVALNNFTYKMTAKKFANFILKLNSNTYIEDLTVFVISAGTNPNYDNCIKSLKNQSVKFKIKEINNVSPMSKAYQTMIDTCTTKYYIQIDEDMILNYNAVEIMYNCIKNSDDNIAFVTYKLLDIHLNFDIFGVKIYNHDITHKYKRWNKGKQITEIDFIEKLKNSDYNITSKELVIGMHSPLWNEKLIFNRYFDLMERYKIYGYYWAKEIPKKLYDIFKSNPTDLNLYAFMGALASVANKDIVQLPEKDFQTENEIYTKIRNMLSVEYKFLK